MRREDAIEDAANAVVAHAMVKRALVCLETPANDRRSCRCPPCVLWRQIDKLATALAEADR